MTRQRCASLHIKGRSASIQILTFITAQSNKRFSTTLKHRIVADRCLQAQFALHRCASALDGLLVLLLVFFAERRTNTVQLVVASWMSRVAGERIFFIAFVPLV